MIYQQNIQPTILPKESGRENRIYLILFLIAVLGGAIRKWVTTSSAISNGVLLIQMLVPFVMVFYRTERSLSPFERFPILKVLLFYLTCQVFNPLQASLFHGVLGIVIHAGLWIGLFFYLANRHLFTLSKFINLFLFVAIAETVLAFVQYQLPVDHFLNKYANAEHAVALINDRVRITGTFSYLSGFNAYSIFYALFMWALIRLKYNPWIISMLTVAGIVASFMTGSRAGTLTYLLIVVPVFFKEFSFKQLLGFLWKMLIPAAVCFTILLLQKNRLLLDQIELAYSNFADRVATNRNSGEERWRLIWDFQYFFDGHHFRSIWFGVGTGATYQGAIALFGSSLAVQEFGYVEGEFIRSFLEGGIILIVLKIALATTLVQNLSFNGVVKWIIWLLIVYALPVVFNAHSAAFLFLGIALVDNIIWHQQSGANILMNRERETNAIMQEVQVP